MHVLTIQPRTMNGRMIIYRALAGLSYC